MRRVLGERTPRVSATPVGNATRSTYNQRGSSISHRGFFTSNGTFGDTHSGKVVAKARTAGTPGPGAVARVMGAVA